MTMAAEAAQTMSAPEPVAHTDLPFSEGCPVSSESWPLRERLRYLYRRTSLTQKELAFQCQINSNAISQWFKTNRLPDKHLGRCADCFGVKQETLQIEDETAFVAAVERDLKAERADWSAFVSQSIEDRRDFHLLAAADARMPIERMIARPRGPQLEEVVLNEQVRFRVARKLYKQTTNDYTICLILRDRIGWSLGAYCHAINVPPPRRNGPPEQDFVRLPLARSAIRFPRNGTVTAYALVTSRLIPPHIVSDLRDQAMFRPSAESLAGWIKEQGVRSQLRHVEFLVVSGRSIG